MMIYHSEQLISTGAAYSEFLELFGKAMLGQSELPFLLVRGDGQRLFVVVKDGAMMLCLVRSRDDFSTSVQSTYVDEDVAFRGVSSMCAAKSEHFVDAEAAMEAIQAFFSNRRLSKCLNFRRCLPDERILEFPEPIAAAEETMTRCQIVEKKIAIPNELRTDMQEVWEFLQEVTGDEDINIDFDDAIQIGSLCGGRIDERNDIFLFSYYLDTGEIWSFEVPRHILEDIADGRWTEMTVSASERL